MKKRILLMLLSFLLMIGLPVAAFPASSQAQEPTGDENFILVNYIGRQMTFDLDDTPYFVPGTDVEPDGGRLALQLAPGEHKFAANIPGAIGWAGTFVIQPGQVVAKNAVLGKTPPSVNRDGELVAKPKDIVRLSDFDPFAPPVEEVTLVADTWQPAAAPPGQASIAWINYIGDELTVDLNGQIYKVPPMTNDVPGRLETVVAPGEYTYTASVPNGSLNSKLTMVAGEVRGLSFSGALAKEIEYDIGEKFDPLPDFNMKVTEEDLTAQAATPPEDTAAGSEAAPAEETPLSVEVAAAGEEAASEAVPADAESGVEGLLVKNFGGDLLTFTIADQVYSVAPNEELTIDLPPGTYTYTASQPFVAKSGMFDLAADGVVVLSIVINPAGDTLTVYQN